MDVMIHLLLHVAKIFHTLCSFLSALCYDPEVTKFCCSGADFDYILYICSKTN